VRGPTIIPHDCRSTDPHWRDQSRNARAALIVEPFAALTKKTTAALETEGEALLRFGEEDAEQRDVRFLNHR